MAAWEPLNALVEDLAAAGRVGALETFFAAGQRLADQIHDVRQATRWTTFAVS